MGHFYRGKLHLVRVTDISQGKFPEVREISMDTSKSWKGVFVPEVQEPITMLMKL